MQLPLRVESHRLERDSEQFFAQNLPRTWTFYRPNPDYGVDLVVDIFDDDLATGRELLVQLKASSVSNATVDGGSERITLDIATYNMLWDKLQVVILVKYVASEQTAYWQLLSQVPDPNQDNDTITIRIPRENMLTNLDWARIRNYVEAVHRRKLGARERINLADFT